MNGYLAWGILLGAVLGFFADSLSFLPIGPIALHISELFVRFLKLVSLPVLFLSLFNVAVGSGEITELRNLGKRTLKYTLFTTVIAASVALFLFVLLDPGFHGALKEGVTPAPLQMNYLDHLIQSFPDNPVKPFLDGNIFGVLLIAGLLSLAVTTLPKEEKEALFKVSKALHQLVMRITSWGLKAMPLAAFAFVFLFVRVFSFQESGIGLYLLAVVLANVLQGAIVLPLLLKAKGIPPLAAFRGMWPALTVAFFSKSSSATLPTAMASAKERLGVSPKVADFIFPLCTTINMNGCAAFILITVLFVAGQNGIVFSFYDQLAWIFIATLAAVGNAGVPMGCYFLASAFLASMNVPLSILGAILPFYTMIDMLETALNVWSDSTVALVIDRELKDEAGIVIEQLQEA